MGLKIKRGKGANLVVPTSSMGDIAFLLIIFFMLTSQFMQEASAKHELPTAREIAELQPQELSIILDEDGVLWAMGEETDVNSLKDLVERFQSGKTEEERKEFTVTFKVHNSLEANVYEPVIRKLAELGVKVAFIGKTEK